MIPFTFPTFTNPLNEAGECKVSYLSSVSGLTAWTDYIPVQTVAYTGNIEGMTEATGYQAVHPVGASGNVAWTDYIPVYEDATKTVPWSTDANGYIPVGLSEDGVQAFLDEADIGLGDIPHSAIATAGSLTPNFTRATEKRIPDHEGILRTLIAGELGFPGARRVRNLISTTSEDFSNAAWTKLNGATVAGDGKTVTFTANASSSIAQSYTFVAGNKYILQFKVSTASGTKAFRLSADAVATQTSDEFTATTTPTVVSFAFTAASSGVGAIYLINNAGATAGDIIVENAMHEDRTGCSDTTTPSEYVSVGVASSPAYHGSMVDGVKCFPTDLDGTPLTTMTTPLIELAETNSTIQSNSFATAPWGDVSGAIPISQNVIGPDGAVSAWTFNDNGVGGFMGRYQEYSLTSGTAAAFGIFVKKTTGAQTNYPAIVVMSPTHMSGACLHRTNGTATAVTGFVGRTAIANTIVVEDFNTDYWRVKFTFTPNSTGVWGLYVMPAFNADGTGVSDNTITGTAVFYGMQGRVNGTMVGSYISTTTVPITRNADQLYYTGADIANIKALAAVDFKRESGFATVGIMCELNDGTTNDLVAQYLSSDTDFRQQGSDGAVAQWNPSAATYTPGTLASGAVSFAANDVKMSFNGATQTADTSATIPSVTRLYYGSELGTLQLNGYPGKIYGWTRNLSQSELNAVTA